MTSRKNKYDHADFEAYLVIYLVVTVLSAIVGAVMIGYGFIHHNPMALR